MLRKDAYMPWISWRGQSEQLWLNARKVVDKASNEKHMWFAKNAHIRHVGPVATGVLLENRYAEPTAPATTVRQPHGQTNSEVCIAE